MRVPRTARALAFVLAAGCAASPAPDVDAAPAPDAGIDASTSADAGPIVDAGDGLPRIDDLCLADDGDAVIGLVANETLLCTAGTNASMPLFPMLGALPSDFTRLHALCARMDPTASTRDDLSDPALAADVTAWMTDLLARPALMRAFEGGPSDPAARVAALQAAWYPQNAFEHVLCGELDPSGTGVWGLHLWSEYAQAEGEGRAQYECTRAALDRHEVATVRYRWQPQGRTSFAEKPIGSFQVGMSPACLLALGYVALSRGVPTTPGATPSLHARMYGEEVSFTFASSGGSITTMFPTEQ